MGKDLAVVQEEIIQPKIAPHIQMMGNADNQFYEINFKPRLPDSIRYQLPGPDLDMFMLKVGDLKAFHKEANPSPWRDKQNPLIIVRASVLKEINYIMNKTEGPFGEAGGVLLATKLNDFFPHYVIFDHYMVHQECTAGALDLDGPDLNRFMATMKEQHPEYFAQDADINKMAWHWHHHHKLGCSWSGTDMEQQLSQKQMGFQGQHRGYYLTAMNGLMEFKFIQYEPTFVSYDKPHVAIWIEDTARDLGPLSKEITDSLDAQIALVCKKPVPKPVTTYYGGRTYGEGGAYNWDEDDYYHGYKPKGKSDVDPGWYTKEKEKLEKDAKNKPDSKESTQDYLKRIGAGGKEKGKKQEVDPRQAEFQFLEDMKVDGTGVTTPVSDDGGIEIDYSDIDEIEYSAQTNLAEGLYTLFVNTFNFTVQPSLYLSTELDKASRKNNKVKGMVEAFTKSLGDNLDMIQTQDIKNLATIIAVRAADHKKYDQFDAYSISDNVGRMYRAIRILTYLAEYEIPAEDMPVVTEFNLYLEGLLDEYIQSSEITPMGTAISLIHSLYEDGQDCSPITQIINPTRFIIPQYTATMLGIVGKLDTVVASNILEAIMEDWEPIKAKQLDTRINAIELLLGISKEDS